MNSLQWLAQTVNGDSENRVANRSGVTGSTLNRQIGKGVLSPETVVAVARAYQAPVLPGLVACGLITHEEASVSAPLGVLLSDASDEALVDEVLRRIKRDSEGAHPAFERPLDDLPDDPTAVAVSNSSEIPNSSMATVHELHPSQDTAEETIDEEEELPDFSKMAARKVTSRPEYEAIKRLDDYDADSQIPPDWDDDF